MATIWPSLKFISYTVKKGLVGSTNLIFNMDLGDFFSQIWVKNDHWVQTNVKWVLGSRIFPFSEEVWSIILTIRYCLRTTDLLFFSCF